MLCGFYLSYTSWFPVECTCNSNEHATMEGTNVIYNHSLYNHLPHAGFAYVW